jgi:hypothetical protein
MGKIILNVVVFQAAWFACAYGASHGTPAIGVAGCAVALAVGLATASNWKALALLSAALGLYGFIAESLMVSAGVIAYRSPGPIDGIAPFWIVALWMAFAALVTTSLAWMRGRPILAVVLGGLVAPVSYWAAERFDALTLSEPLWTGLLAIALTWAIAMPAALRLSTWPIRWSGTP